MAASGTGFWNPIGHTGARESAAGIPMAATSTSGGDSAKSTPSNISANDFLTLLVTEMQNQDPTANTDPNEYINQLVQVNSLEQLISINQTLTADSKAASSSGPGTKKDAVETTAASTAAAKTQTLPTPSEAATVSGNLTIPATNPSALRVAQTFGPVLNRQ